MTAAVATAASVAQDLGQHLAGDAAAIIAEPPKLEPELKSALPAEDAGDRFSFDEDFQAKICALSMRDPSFMAAAAHLLKPSYFENVGHSLLINMVLRYYSKYHRLPEKATFAQLIKDDLKNRIIREEHYKPLVDAWKATVGADIADRDYAVEKIAEFARHQAVGQAIYDSVTLREKGQFDKIEKLMRDAISVGAVEDGGDYDYWAAIEQRTAVRLDKAAGLIKPQGITTGIHAINERLYHKGWGRKELSVILGGAKAGKTIGLVNFAKYASLAGYNVLYVTLEVSRDIIADRMDASLSSTMMNELEKSIHDVRTKIEALQAKSGRLEIREYPTGTFSPADLRRLLERYRAKGIRFDIVVCDYADIMAPSHRTDDPIENSKHIYMEMRAIAIEQDLAMLTATQTNRTGFTAAVAKAEHVAEDFNKVRLADLMISINASDEERKNNEARLYFTASRNQESGFTVLVKQDRARMQFVVSVVSIE